MATRSYYLAEAGYNDSPGGVAAPKPVIDLILAEKYGWLPQEIDAIPKRRMEEMMLVLNARLNINAEVSDRQERGGEKTGPPVIGQGGIRKMVPV